MLLCAVARHDFGTAARRRGEPWDIARHSEAQCTIGFQPVSGRRLVTRAKRMSFTGMLQALFAHVDQATGWKPILQYAVGAPGDSAVPQFVLVAVHQRQPACFNDVVRNTDRTPIFAVIG